VWLVRATDDEMRNKVNSEESKTQRDFVLRLCPRDILDECQDLVEATIKKGDPTDPQGPMKRVLDRFREVAGVMPGDLETYMGKKCENFTTDDLAELMGLGASIRDGQTTFAEAMKAKYTAINEQGEDQPGSAEAARAVADAKIAALGKAQTPAGAGSPGAPAPAPQAAPAPPAGVDWATVRTYEDWPDDPMAPALGLYIVVQGVRYEREATDAEAWKVAPTPPATPAPVAAAPRRPLNLGRGTRP